MGLNISRGGIRFKMAEFIDRLFSRFCWFTLGYWGQGLLDWQEVGHAADCEIFVCFNSCYCGKKKMPEELK